MAQRRLTIVLVAALVVAASWSTAAPARTTVFNDVSINKRVDGDVIAFEADVRLGPRADIEGDVVVVGGRLKMDDQARVGRHVLVVFGTLEMASASRVDGRALSLSSLSSVLLRPGAEVPLHVDLALRLLTSGGWLLVATTLAFGCSTRVRSAIWLVPRLGLEVALLGVAAAVTFLAAVVAVLGLGPTIGVPLAASLTVVFLVLRAVGLTVIGGLLGAAVLGRTGRRVLPLTLEVFVGVLLLLVVRFVPWVGGVAWSAAAVVSLGVGIMALATAATSDRAAVTVD